MTLSVKVLSPKNWFELSEKAHALVFDKHKPAERDRIDYALICEKKNNAIDAFVGYVTVKELDGESVYWQYGGAFPQCKNTLIAFKGFGLFLDWTAKKYKRVSLMVANTNVSMLKFAMKAGFRIVGLRVTKEAILLEHILEFKNETDI